MKKSEEPCCFNCIYFDINEDEELMCRHFGMIINENEPICSAYERNNDEQ